VRLMSGEYLDALNNSGTEADSRLIQNWVGRVTYIEPDQWFDTFLIPYSGTNALQAEKRFSFDILEEDQKASLCVGSYLHWKEFLLQEEPETTQNVITFSEGSVSELAGDHLEWASKYVHDTQFSE